MWNHLNKDLDPEGIEKHNLDFFPWHLKPPLFELLGVPLAIVEEGICCFLFVAPGEDRGDAE